MPTYKNRVPMAPNTQVWHYTKLEAIIAMLRDRQIRLTRLDAFRDPFEGSVPKKQIDDQVAILGGATATEMMMRSVTTYYPDMQVPRHPDVQVSRMRDLWQEVTQRRRAKTRSAHAICWSAGDESEAMWKLYCSDGDKGQGLALRSQLSKLEESIAGHDLVVSPVRYRFFHEGDAFDDELDPFMHKRKGFACEQEVGLLSYDDAHYLALTSFLGRNAAAAPPDELPTYRFIDWSLTSAIDSITLSPYASEAYESRARDAIAAIDPKLVVELSVLSERRYAANF
jgi:hypothetical protein